MTMLPFNLLFPDVAKDEARALLVKWPQGDLPVDTYVLVEHFCAEASCDCWRAALGVIRASTREHVATLSCTFDPAVPDTVPARAELDARNPQSTISQPLLELFRESCADDPAYVARLERHYTMFRKVVNDPAHPLHARLRAPTPSKPPLPAPAPPPAPAAGPSRIPPAYRQWGTPRGKP
jgi:hypothetical protein